MDKQTVPPALDQLKTPKPRRAAAYDPASELVKPSHLRTVVGLSGCTIWRLRRVGQFPAPIKLSIGRIGWRRSDLEAWLTERQAASR